MRSNAPPKTTRVVNDSSHLWPNEPIMRREASELSLTLSRNVCPPCTKSRKTRSAPSMEISSHQYICNDSSSMG